MSQGLPKAMMFRFALMGYILLVFGFCCVDASSNNWLVNDPKTPWPEVYVLNNEDGVSAIVDAELNLVSGESDGEFVDAMEHYFWDRGGGVVIELGALDGGRATNSVSKPLEKFNWKRILLEANPIHRESLGREKLAYSVNAAVCDESEVHFVATRGGLNMTSGIVEFMEPKFVKQYHYLIYKLGTVHGSTFDSSTVDWSSNHLKGLDITPVKCVSLAHVLKEAGVSHVDFLVLDVEGAELPILKTLDLDSVRIDVMAIERNNGHALLNYFKTDPRMSDLYKFVVERGRNYWLMRKDFKLSSRPGVSPDCYRGSVKSGVMGSKWQLCKGSLPLPKRTTQ